MSRFPGIPSFKTLRVDCKMSPHHDKHTYFSRCTPLPSPLKKIIAPLLVDFLCISGANTDNNTAKVKNAAEDESRPGDGGLQGIAELADMDDWGSAWQDAKNKGEGWGGRGKGGRGIQRNTWQPKDVYVEGEGRDVREASRTCLFFVLTRSPHR